MPNKCFVWGCDSGQIKANLRYDKAGEPRPSLIRAPKAEVLRAKWNSKIPRKDRVLGPNDHVCSLHFWPDELITHKIIQLKDGTSYQAPTVPHVQDGCVPSRFPGPRYLSQEAPKRRPPPKQRDPIPPKKRRGTCTSAASTHQLHPESLLSLPELQPGHLIISPTQPPTPTAADIELEKEIVQDSLQQHIPPTDYNDHNYALESMFTISDLRQALKEVVLPDEMWAVHWKNEKIGFIHCNDSFQTDKAVIFSQSMVPDVNIACKAVEAEEIKSKKQLEELLQKVHGYKACVGATDSGGRSGRCKGYVDGVGRKLPERCLDCKLHRRALQKKRKPSDKSKRIEKLKKRMKQNNQKKRRLEKKVLSLKEQLKKSAEDCKKISERKVEEIILLVPAQQQELVRNIFSAAKSKTARGRRYRREYVFECLLMRVKGHALYKKLRLENKLPLPSEQTLSRYMKGLQPEYGFQASTFSVMKKKAALFSEDERHGCLLLDEMQLDANLSFRRDTLEIHGMVDLGTQTSEADKHKRGDHGLVIMFQPFKGQWVQAVGAFLGAGAVPGKVLEKLVLEAVIYLHNSGYYVDIVTTDGAKWNRSMWNLVGINRTSSSCVHPCDPDRKLWYGSDFPHLIKCLWARLTSKKELVVPEGVIKLTHWQSVVNYNKQFSVKICYTINDDHISPTNYQKMNVKMAFQFFGESVATSMEHLRDKIQIPDLADSLPTIKFIRRINGVIKAMNSRSPLDGLRADPQSKENKVLREFLTYLLDMDEMAAVRRELSSKRVSSSTRKRAVNAQKINVGAADEMTTDTFLGLVVTVRAALELAQYLTDKLQYTYLMTRRINQDALEHFFGKVRSSCGSGSHPDPLLFIQIFRLLSGYSLVKPPRGSNVQGGELLQVLVELKDLAGEKSAAKRAELEQKIDDIIDSDIPESPEECGDHTYLRRPIDPFALTVLGGYVSRKMRGTKPAKACSQCYDAVCSPEEGDHLEREEYLKQKSRGGLLKPSQEMYEVIFQIEQAVLRTVSREKLHSNTLFSILEEMIDNSHVESFGCETHRHELTAGIISFFLMCRMHFICREANREIAEKKRKQRNMAKLAKLEGII